jgi:hypothetical protein
LFITLWRTSVRAAITSAVKILAGKEKTRQISLVLLLSAVAPCNLQIVVKSRFILNRSAVEQLNRILFLVNAVHSGKLWIKPVLVKLTSYSELSKFKAF